MYIANVTSGVATKVFETLNSDGSENRKRGMKMVERTEEEAYRRGEVDMVYREWLREMGRREGAVERREAGNLTLGYVTTDVRPFYSPDFVHMMFKCDMTDLTSCIYSPVQVSETTQSTPHSLSSTFQISSPPTLPPTPRTIPPSTLCLWISSRASCCKC